ncbi:methyltransferase [Pectobacterium versatile]|uniref:methyltransferase n=1 Tax=Pectobacterium versatile TaxID=2488639 RepID=UPI0020BFB02D|nr:MULTISPECIES: methyltransferase [Pectobacterium]
MAKECQASEKNIYNIIKVLEIFGLTLYEHLAHSASRAEIYDLAMRDLSRPVGYVLVKEYASLFKTVGSVVDIGGGSGGAGLNTVGALFFYFFLMLT